MFRGVTMTGDVTYRKIDDAGLHIETGGRPQTLKVDTIVVCAGQESADDALSLAQSLGKPVHMIGGVDKPQQLDAVKAIEDGTRLALFL